MNLAIGFGPVVTVWDAATTTTMLQFIPGADQPMKSPTKVLTKAVTLLAEHHVADVLYSPNGQAIATCSQSSFRAIISQSNSGVQQDIIDHPMVVSSSHGLKGSNQKSGIPWLHFGGGGRYLGLTYYNSNKAYIYNIVKSKWARSFTSQQPDSSKKYPLHLQKQMECTKVCFDPTNTLLSCLIEFREENLSFNQLFRMKEGDCAASVSRQGRNLQSLFQQHEELWTLVF